MHFATACTFWAPIANPAAKVRSGLADEFLLCSIVTV